MANKRSEFYWDSKRNQCTNPDHYDRMIQLVMLHGAKKGDIDFATVAVNRCIDGALAEKGGYSTGGCMALYSAIYHPNKVRLFFEPLSELTIPSQTGEAAHE